MRNSWRYGPVILREQLKLPTYEQLTRCFVKRYGILPALLKYVFSPSDLHKTFWYFIVYIDCRIIVVVFIPGYVVSTTSLDVSQRGQSSHFVYIYIVRNLTTPASRMLVPNNITNTWHYTPFGSKSVWQMNFSVQRRITLTYCNCNVRCIYHLQRVANFARCIWLT